MLALSLDHPEYRRSRDGFRLQQQGLTAIKVQDHAL